MPVGSSLCMQPAWVAGLQGWAFPRPPDGHPCPEGPVPGVRESVCTGGPCSCQPQRGWVLFLPEGDVSWVHLCDLSVGEHVGGDRMGRRLGTRAGSSVTSRAGSRPPGWPSPDLTLLISREHVPGPSGSSARVDEDAWDVPAGSQVAGAATRATFRS